MVFVSNLLSDILEPCAVLRHLNAGQLTYEKSHLHLMLVLAFFLARFSVSRQSRLFVTQRQSEVEAFFFSPCQLGCVIYILDSRDLPRSNHLESLFSTFLSFTADTSSQSLSPKL